MGLFSKPKTPKAPTVQDLPTAPAEADAAAAAAEEMARQQRRRGFGAALVTEGRAAGLGAGNLGAGARLTLGGGQ